MIRIVIADDHDVVRQGQLVLLGAEEDFRVVGEATDGLEAVRLTEELEPDVLIVDISMPALNGIEVIRRVRESTPRTHVVVFSMHTGQSYVAQTFRNGARGYVAKSARADDLITAVRAVVRGERYLGHHLS